MSAQLYPWPPRVVYSRSGLPVCTKCFNRDVLTESCTKKNQPRLTPQTRPFQIKRRLQRNADGTSALFKSPMNSCHRCVDCGHQSSKKKMSYLPSFIYRLLKCVAMIFHEAMKHDMNKFMWDDRSGPGKTTIMLMFYWFYWYLPWNLTLFFSWRGVFCLR